MQGAVAHSWVYCQRSYSWIGRISRLITVTYLLFELLSKLLQFLVTLPFHSDCLMLSRRSTSTAILNLRQPVVQSVTLFCCTFHRCHLMLPSVSFIFSSNSPSWVSIFHYLNESSFRTCNFPFRQGSVQSPVSRILHFHMTFFNVSFTGIFYIFIVPVMNYLSTTGTSTPILSPPFLFLVFESCWFWTKCSKQGQN